jgi:hypothetical protein
MKKKIESRIEYWNSFIKDLKAGVEKEGYESTQHRIDIADRIITATTVLYELHLLLYES